MISVGYVGPSCINACEVNPCSNGARCVENTLSHRGYSCKCNSSEFSGIVNKISAILLLKWPLVVLHALA
jgi:hypothetical protein